MTERDYAIRSFKEITLNAARHTEERMDLYYEKMKALMNNYQDLILENQFVLDELGAGVSGKRSMRIWPMLFSIWMLTITA